MTRRTLALLAALAAAPPAAAPADAPDDAKAVAEKVTTAGASMFDARDAKGLADTYVDDARFDLILREPGTGSLKTETRTGRADIQAYYENLFRGDQNPHARNTVEYARFVGPDLLLIAGVFEPDTEAPEPRRLPFTQVRRKQAGAWRVVSLQLIVTPKD